jgi:hypothetical protein
MKLPMRDHSLWRDKEGKIRDEAFLHCWKGGGGGKMSTALVRSCEAAMVDQSGKRSLLLGLGLDGTDGHVRVTRGEDFRLLGGSQETHQRMQEVAVKLTEKLARRGKRLGDASGQEIRDLVGEVGLGEARSEE